MGVILRVEAQGYRDIQGRFARRTTGLARGQREMVRAAADQMKLWLRFYAPHKTGVFEGGISYRTDETASGTTATFYVRGEHAYLLPFLLQGTRPHLIPRGGKAEQMAKGYPLHWVDEATGKDCYAWEVHHPGTKPSPFVDQARESATPFARAAMQTVARQAVI